MNCVHLHDNGQLYFGEKQIKADPLRYSGYEVRLSPTCTLRSFFRCMVNFPDLVKVNPFLDSFLQYIPQCPEEKCLCEDIDHLALMRTVEIIGFPAPARMELSVSLEGVQGGERLGIRAFWLENLLDMPLKLGRLHHVVFGDALNSMAFDTVYTLFELIDGICWQLSFHNRPAVCRLPQ